MRARTSQRAVPVLSLTCPIWGAYDRYSAHTLQIRVLNAALALALKQGPHYLRDISLTVGLTS
jgi:hypothetical protein